MACVDLQLIDGDECIGASLPKINGNFAALSAAVCDLSANIPDTSFNVFDSPTIDLNWNASTKTLSADVKDASITNAKIAFDGGAFCFRNKIINGNFDIWQRETSLGSGTGSRYLSDRFVNNSTGSTYTASQQLFTNGQTDVPNSPDYYHRTVVSSVAGNNNFCSLLQRVESVKTLAGKTATISFYAKADSNKPISIEFGQVFGNGGTPSPFVSIPVQKINLTTTWQKFELTANIPSIAGKTIGTNNDDNLAVLFWFDAHSNFNARTNSLGQQSGTFDIAQVQLEEGPTATPFEHRPIGTELALCQRYYQFEVSRYHTFPAGPYSEATHDIRITPMRTSPATTITILGSARLGTYGSPLFGGTAEKLRFNADHDAATTSAGYVNYSWTADAEL